MNPLFGLVLSGGFSTRMGKDKGSLVYGKLTARERCFQLLKKHCSQVFISCRKDQDRHIPKELPRVFDIFDSSFGPASGILSAYYASKEKLTKKEGEGQRPGWLVMACDMPEVDDDAIQTLIQNRNVNQPATAYVDLNFNFPQPLLAIWEWDALKALDHNFSLQKRSPRKTLEEVGYHPVLPKRPQLLMSVNTREEYLNWNR